MFQTYPKTETGLNRFLRVIKSENNYDFDVQHERFLDENCGESHLETLFSEIFPHRKCYGEKRIISTVFVDCIFFFENKKLYRCSDVDGLPIATNAYGSAEKIHATRTNDSKRHGWCKNVINTTLTDRPCG